MVWLQSAVPFIGIILLFQRTNAQLMPLQYHLINGSLTWYEAQSFCRVKYTDLATVNNPDDNNMLVNILGSHVTYSWIGLQKGGTRRWMWSDGRGNVNFINWADGEPKNSTDNVWCGQMSDTGMWNDYTCGAENGFVCYESQQDDMTMYVYYSRGTSWVDSQELCRSNHTDMAYVSNEVDNSEIASFVRNQEVWIGLFNDAWMWSNGEETSFRYWLSSTSGTSGTSGTQNLGNCASVAASQQGRWVEAPCNEKSTFVCQGGLKVKRMVIRMKVHSGVDLADFTVSDALLKKLEEVLKHQGVTDFTLRWRSDKNGLVFQHNEQLEVAEKAGF